MEFSLHRTYWFTSFNIIVLIIWLVGMLFNLQYDDGGIGGLYYVFIPLFCFMFLLAGNLIELILSTNADFWLVAPIGLLLAFCVDLLRIKFWKGKSHTGEGTS